MALVVHPLLAKIQPNADDVEPSRPVESSAVVYAC